MAILPAAVEDAVDPDLATQDFIEDKILTFDKNAVASSLQMRVPGYDTHFGRVFESLDFGDEVSDEAISRSRGVAFHVVSNLDEVGLSPAENPDLFLHRLSDFRILAVLMPRSPSRTSASASSNA